MALETTNITFYQIKQCGYFAFGEDAPAFGNTLSLLKEVAEWSKGKTLIETKLNEPVGEILPTYLLDIQEFGEAWLLTIWNEVPSTRQNVASVMATSAVGKADVVMNEIKKGSIPGFATYFWLHPDKGVFASLRFQHLVTAQKAMQEYLESFLELAASHVVSTAQVQEVAELEILGYRKDPSDENSEVQRLYPKFRTQMVRRPGKHAMILKNSDRITRVERSTLLKLDRPEDLDTWQHFLRWTKIHQPQQRPDRMRIRYRLTTPVSHQDVESMIEAWNQGAEKQWDDYGFVFRGSADIHWLSHSLARSEQDLDVDRDNDEVVNGLSILKALHPMKATLLQTADA